MRRNLQFCFKSWARLCQLQLQQCFLYFAPPQWHWRWHAAAQLLPLVYDELRRLAAQKLAQEKPGQTLDAMTLVHEAYLRLVGPNIVLMGHHALVPVNISEVDLRALHLDANLRRSVRPESATNIVLSVLSMWPPRATILLSAHFSLIRSALPVSGTGRGGDRPAFRLKSPLSRKNDPAAGFAT